MENVDITITEPARVLPVSDEAGVLVCGGGVAGIAAALDVPEL